jgi:hypothetical protein
MAIDNNEISCEDVQIVTSTGQRISADSFVLVDIQTHCSLRNWKLIKIESKFKLIAK